MSDYEKLNKTQKRKVDNMICPWMKNINVILKRNEKIGDHTVCNYGSIVIQWESKGKKFQTTISAKI